jgi:hypothetical protein
MNLISYEQVVSSRFNITRNLLIDAKMVRFSRGQYVRQMLLSGAFAKSFEYYLRKFQFMIFSFYHIVGDGASAFCHDAAVKKILPDLNQNNTT